MMSLLDFIESNISTDNLFTCAICLGIIWVVTYDFYHILFNSICTWFTRK